MKSTTGINATGRNVRQTVNRVDKTFHAIKSKKFRVIGVAEPVRGVKIKKKALATFWREVDSRGLKHTFLSLSPDGQYTYLPAVYTMFYSFPRVYVIDQNRKIRKCCGGNYNAARRSVVEDLIRGLLGQKQD